jgi:hypothetical protein
MPSLGTAGKIKRDAFLARRQKTGIKPNHREEEPFFPLFLNLRWKGFAIATQAYFAKTGFCSYLIAEQLGAAAEIYLMDVDFSPTLMHTARELALLNGAAILVRAQETLSVDEQTLLAYAVNEMAGKIRVKAFGDLYPELAKLLNPSLYLT